MLSTIALLSQKLERRWLPKWGDAFTDHENGGFYERLDFQFMPVDMPYKRLVSQCRLISLYAHSTLTSKTNRYKDDLTKSFQFLMDHYYVLETGGYIFSVTNEGAPYDKTYDLYGHAFVLFMLSHYGKISKKSCLDQALSVVDFIRKRFSAGQGLGYHEALDEDLRPLDRVRRQNPHMHLFEACLFAYETWKHPEFMRLADELLGLMFRCFYDERSGCLHEFFDAQLAPHYEQGHVCEAGHHYEWIWLLARYKRLRPGAGGKMPVDLDKIDQAMIKLHYWAFRFGYDIEYGGFYNTNASTGEVIDDNKRIWPLSEALKAHACLMDRFENKDLLKSIMRDVLRVFEEGYMQERGFWTEVLKRDFTPVTDYMPATTCYHLYFGIVETQEILGRRGVSKSLTEKPRAFLYDLQRDLSSLYKTIKAKLIALNEKL